MNHRNLATVVQRLGTEASGDEATLMAFGYQYNQIGQLTGARKPYFRDGH